MARNFQPGYGFGGGPRSFSTGARFGSMSRPAAPPILLPSGPRMSVPSLSGYGSSNSGSSTYDSGFNKQNQGYGSKDYSQGYSNQSYNTSSGFQSQSFNSSSTYNNYSAPTNSGIKSASGSFSGNYDVSNSSIRSSNIGSYSANNSATGASGGVGQFSGSGNKSSIGSEMKSYYNKSGDGSGQYSRGLSSEGGIDSAYRGAGPGSGNIARSTTDKLTLSDFIDDKRGDKSWDPVKRKYIQDQDRLDLEEHESAKKPKVSSPGGYDCENYILF